MSKKHKIIGDEKVFDQSFNDFIARTDKEDALKKKLPSGGSGSGVENSLPGINEGIFEEESVDLYPDAPKILSAPLRASYQRNVDEQRESVKKASKAYATAQGEGSVEEIESAKATRTEDTLNDTTSKPKESKASKFNAAMASGIDVMGSMAAKIPSYLLDLGLEAARISSPSGYALPQTSNEAGQLVEQTTGLSQEYNPLSPNNALAEMYEAKAKENESYAFGQYRRGISEMLEDGNYSGAVEQAALRIVQTLPLMAGLFATRGAGASEVATYLGIGLGTGAEKLKTLQQESPELSKRMMLVNSIITGASESGTELLGTGQIYNQARKLYMSGAKDQAREVLGKGIKGYFDAAFKKFFVGVSALDEGTTEAVNAVIENATDKWSGARPNANYTDGVLDAFIVGVGAGGVMAAPFHIASKLKKANNKKTAKALTNEQNEIEKFMGDPDLSPAVKETLAETHAKNNERINDIIAEEEKTVDKTLTPEQASKIESLNQDIDAKEAIISDPQVPPVIKEETQKSIDALETDIEAITKEAESAINDLKKPVSKPKNEEDKPATPVKDNESKVQSEPAKPDKESISVQDGKSGDTVKSESVTVAKKDDKQTKVEPKDQVQDDAAPTEIAGFKVIEEAETAPGGEKVFKVDDNGSERFLTLDGKELKVNKTPSVEVEAVEVREEIESPKIPVTGTPVKMYNESPVKEWNGWKGPNEGENPFLYNKEKGELYLNTNKEDFDYGTSDIDYYLGRYFDLRGDKKDIINSDPKSLIVAPERART